MFHLIFLDNYIPYSFEKNLPLSSCRVAEKLSIVLVLIFEYFTGCLILRTLSICLIVYLSSVWFCVKNDLKVVLVTMKRQNSSENDQEGYKEPRLAEESGSLNRSVRTILRRSIELRQAEQSEESASKSEDNSKLRHWAALLSNAGFSCELRPIVESDSSPFPVEGKAPLLALIVEQTKSLRFSVTTGPFQSVRLIFYPDGEWRLDNPICEHQKLAGGRLSFPVESTELENIENDQCGICAMVKNGIGLELTWKSSVTYQRTSNWRLLL